MLDSIFNIYFVITLFIGFFLLYVFKYNYHVVHKTNKSIDTHFSTF